MFPLLAALAALQGHATLQDLDVPTRPVASARIELTLAGRKRALVVRSFSHRSDRFAVFVQDADGSLEQVRVPAATTYRGRTASGPETVAASLHEGHLWAAVFHPNGDAWFVEPAGRRHRVYRLPRGFDTSSCVALPAAVPAAPAAPPTPSNNALKFAEIAFDADYEYFQRNGSSVANTVRTIEAALAATNAIYERDVAILHLVSRIIVRTAEPDPYGSLDPRTLLSTFRSHWNANHRSVRRDVAHFFTGKQTTTNIIGLAWVGVLCTSSAYSLSVHVPGFGQRVTILGHELGHNWSAPHCLDPSCVLMCGGCHRFGPKTRAKILGHKGSRSCLDDLRPPVLSSLAPVSVPSHEPGIVTVTGRNFYTVTGVEVGGRSASNVTRLDSTRLSFTPPSPAAIARSRVIVKNAAGSSSALWLTVRGNHPSVTAVPAVARRGVTETYRVHTDRGWLALLHVSPSRQPSSLPGIVDLGIGNRFRSLILLGALAADATGTASTALRLPASLPPFWAYWQAVTIDPTTMQLPFEVSNVAASWVF